MPIDNLSLIEEKILGNYRVLGKEDQDAIRRLTTTIAELSGLSSGAAKLPSAK